MAVSRYLRSPLLLSAGALLSAASPLLAQSDEVVPALPQSTADIMWLLIAAVLVFFMQAGFALVESGLTRAKNACNIMMKNLLDFCLGALAFWAIGYMLMYGESGNGLIGWDPSLLFLGSASAAQDFGLSAGWLFQVVFAATAATIVSGAMAERTKFRGYVAYSVLISAFIYPIAGHWIWSGSGWLGGMGMRDFAGSTVVHSVGAWAALAGAMILGPRLGKYTDTGEVRPIPGHNLPFATLGVFILWFGWFGFNAGSTLAAVDGIAHVAVTTTLAAAAGAIAATFTTWLRFGKPDLTMALNGTLAGLVGITAPCASVNTLSAVLIGLIAGIIVVFAILFIETKLKIDDPVGAISVHGICGAWGTLSIGLFGQSSIDALFWSEETAIKDGLFFGGGVSQLLIQLAGVASVFVFAFGTAYAVFFAIDRLFGLRVSPEEEMEGLDLGEHGNEAYADFTQYQDSPELLATAKPAPITSI
ncbi:MAG: ammonium transporter [Verrucomicrobiota bacterium JB022]|nr:ammonium transporter [Verrucomicrobiota bacterium JB022]